MCYQGGTIAIHRILEQKNFKSTYSTAKYATTGLHNKIIMRLLKAV